MEDADKAINEDTRFRVLTMNYERYEMHIRHHILTIIAKVVGTHLHIRTKDYFSIITFNVNDAGASPS